MPDKQDPRSFETIAERLEEIAERLEGGDTKLEEAVALFEEGIRLGREGEARLDAAERRIEQLLAGEQTAPLDLDATAVPAPPSQTPPQPNEDDVPF